jgi:hypothetical protein
MTREISHIERKSRGREVAKYPMYGLSSLSISLLFTIPSENRNDRTIKRKLSERGNVKTLSRGVLPNMRKTRMRKMEE